MVNSNSNMQLPDVRASGLLRIIKYVWGGQVLKLEQVIIIFYVNISERTSR